MTGNGCGKLQQVTVKLSLLHQHQSAKLLSIPPIIKKVEILDAETNHSIATRLIPDDGIITAVGKIIRFTGEASINDSFSITNNTQGIGDNRNILQMIDLQESDVNGLNSGSFSGHFQYNCGRNWFRSEKWSNGFR